MSNVSNVSTMHPHTEHYLDEMDFDAPDWSDCAKLEDELHDREGAAHAKRLEENWEQDTLADTAEWRAEIEEETGQSFTDADWLEFVTDEMVSRAEAMNEDAEWRSGC